MNWSDLPRIGTVSWRLQVTRQYGPNWKPDDPFWTDLPHGFRGLPRFTTD